MQTLYRSIESIGNVSVQRERIINYYRELIIAMHGKDESCYDREKTIIQLPYNLVNNKLSTIISDEKKKKKNLI